MSATPKSVSELFISRFGDRVTVGETQCGIVSLDISVEHWLEVCRGLRDDKDFSYEQLTDLCGVDYLGYGQSEWETEQASSEGFSRGIDSLGPGRFGWAERPEAGHVEQRFVTIVHLLSFRHNKRLRIRCFAPDEGMPIMPSLVEIWNSANWYEREAFDLFGIVFEGHPDLRRIMTDYGFTGHPFRKDFPLIGNVAVRYDTRKKRVIYEAVEIEPRVLVPRVLRSDTRYKTDEVDLAADARAEELAAEESVSKKQAGGPEAG
jgi:NADH-quinone oxidoreductase subunit C